MFSKSCEYGIRAAIYIASESYEGRRSGMKEISAAIESPEAFTAKILQILSRSGIIDSVKGPNGGFIVEKSKLPDLSLSRIVTAIDGDSIYRGCGLGLQECSELRPCPLHDKFKAIRDELREMLENTNILDLSLSLKDGLCFLKR